MFYVVWNCLCDDEETRENSPRLSSWTDCSHLLYLHFLISTQFMLQVISLFLLTANLIHGLLRNELSSYLLVTVFTASYRSIYKITFYYNVPLYYRYIYLSSPCISWMNRNEMDISQIIQSFMNAFIIKTI